MTDKLNNLDESTVLRSLDLCFVFNMVYDTLKFLSLSIINNFFQQQYSFISLISNRYIGEVFYTYKACYMRGDNTFLNKKGTARAQLLYTQSTETANAPGHPSSPPQLLTSFYYY